MKKYLTALILLVIVLQHSALAQYKPTTSTSLYQVTYEVDADGSYMETVESLTRVDTQQGIDRAGQDQIYYIDSLEKVEVIDAYTLLPNGKKIPVGPESIKTQVGSGASNAPMFADDKVKFIIYPQVEVGSQLYYKSKSHHHTPVFPGHFYAYETVSPHEIYDKVLVNLVHSSAIKVQVDSDRFDGGRVESQPGDPAGSFRYQFSYRQSEAYPTEASQISYRDFAPSLTFSTMNDYQTLGSAYYARAEPAAKPTPDIEQLAHKLVEEASTERDKVKRIYEWVQKNIRYVAIYAGAGGYVPHSAQSILDNRYGDCKDHTVILESLLHSIGIASTPALIDNGNSFKLPRLAIPNTFNHVISYVPSLNLYLDSTSEFARFGLLPSSDMDKNVLHVATGILANTPRRTTSVDFTETRVKLQLKMDGSMVGSSHTLLHGFYEVASRASSHRRANADPDRIAFQLLERFKESGSGRIITPDALDLNNDWEQNAQFILDELVNIPGPSALSIPVGLARGDLKNMSTLVIPKARRFPSNCASERHVEVYEVDFPTGIKVTSVPKGVIYKRSSITYTSTYVLAGHRLTVRREMIDEQSSPVCAADDDDVWREFAPILRRDLRSQVMIR